MFHFGDQPHGTYRDPPIGKRDQTLARRLLLQSERVRPATDQPLLLTAKTPQPVAKTLRRSRSGNTGLDGVILPPAPELTVAQSSARDRKCQLIDPLAEPPDRNLVQRYGVINCLQDGVLPWREMGGDTIVLVDDPANMDRFLPGLSAEFGPVRTAITTREHIDRYIARHFTQQLVVRAEERVIARESCRSWNSRRARGAAVLILAALLILMTSQPQLVFGILTGWALLYLVLTTILKAVAAYLGLRATPTQIPPTPAKELPTITILVPLYQENAIADHLLARLRALEYPQHLLDICLVLEADDTTTRKTLGRTILPIWMRAVTVPKGTIKTKPRALNYALDFARGSIIGVWDAEDAPDPHQLHVVADYFANCPRDVACLQGTLDYYNSSSNWLTRSFTLEYAGWFRVVLPGLQRLNLVVPLGGTTLFFRRDLLETLGGWDAHNVTEDADLGVRLARRGYKTQLIPTVTYEEANGRAWPWVKQRSRWLKGYAITYAVHMRNPAQLWRDLGPWRFWGMQLLFLGTLTQCVLAPLLWSFWLVLFGIDHPLAGLVPPWAGWAMFTAFVVSELVNLIVVSLGAKKARKLWLIKWALTLQFYFPLAAIAAYKGLWELVSKPFYWDKTAHGVLLPANWLDDAATPQLQRQPRPVSIA